MSGGYRRNRIVRAVDNFNNLELRPDSGMEAMIVDGTAIDEADKIQTTFFFRGSLGFTARRTYGSWLIK